MLWSDSILNGKRILITGASSGIGRSCAVLCSQLGAEIIACGRNKERLAETLAALYGSGHVSLECELNNEGEIGERFSVLRGTKPISGFIHSAGIERTNPLKTIDMEDFVEMFKTNVASAVSISKFIMRPGMYDKIGLSIVLISSISGVKGEKGKIEYSSTKAAVIGLVKPLALELAGKGARVNSISPAMVDSEMLEASFQNLPESSVKTIMDKHLLGIIEPLDVSNLAVFLISDLSKRITGINVTLDSGYTIG